ncbi:MAG: DUF2341 domain-containing protein, partial [Candidatus Aureabacteria bacterium]|nr:DUF2341 domain-containing protein [Candidatus Auribacterota bacterium]
GATNSSWAEDTNWDPFGDPDGDTVQFTSGSNASLIDYSVSITSLTINGYTGTLTLGAGNTLTITGNYSQNTGTFTGGSSNITVSGNFTLSGGTFTSTSATLSVGGNWSDTAESFTHNSGTVDLNGSGAQSITIGFKPFYNLIHSGSGTVTLSPVWSYRKEITILSSMVANTDQANFPVLIYRASDANLAANAQADGDDIVFTLSNGTKLSHEIEKYTSATGELYVWVKVPILSASSDTVLYMYYGNATCSSQQDATGVWDSNYVMVQHMREDPSGSAPQMIDSTSNDNDGTSYGTMLTGDQVAGQIDGSLEFDGGDDYIGMNNTTDFNGPFTQLTISGWFEVKGDGGSSSAPNDQAILYKTRTTTTGGFHVWYQETEERVYGYVKTNGTTNAVYSDVTGPDIPQNQLTHFDLLWDGSTLKLYINGSLKDSVVSPGNSDFGTLRLTLGSCEDLIGTNYDREFNGIIDEIRISNTARSADWISTSYNNQNDPASYETVGSESAVTTASLTVANNLTQSAGTFDIEDNNLNVSGTLLVSGGILDGSDALCNLDIGGNVAASAGTLSAPAALDDTSFTVAGNWEISGTGILTPNSGRVVFDTFSTGKTLTTSSSGADDFYDVTFNNSSGGWTIQDELTVTNVLTVTAGTLDSNDQALSINGDTTINGGTLKTGTGIVTFGDAAEDTVTISSGDLHIESDNTSTDIVKNAGTWTNSGGAISYNADTVVDTNLLSSISYYNLTINSSDSTYTTDGAVTVSNDFTLTNGTASVNGQSLTVTADYIQSNGTFTCGSGTLRVDTNFTKSGGTFNEDTGTVTFGGTTDGTFDVDTSETFNNVTINKTTDVSDILTITSGDTIVITGTLALTDGEVTGAVNAQGNVTVGASFNQGDANITFSGTSNQTITMTGDKFPTGILTVNKASNTATTSGTLTLTGALTIQEGTLSLGGNTNFNGGITVENGGTLSCSTGGTTITIDDADTVTVNTGGTITLQGGVANLIVLQSDTTATWDLVCNGLYNFDYLNLIYSDASGGPTVFAATSTDGGNNTNWVFNTGATITWDGSASADWFTAANWDLNRTPTEADDVIINITDTANISQQTQINSLTLGNASGTTSPVFTFTYDAITNGALIIDDGNLIVHTGANITHSAGTTTVVGTVNVDVQTGDAAIYGTINVNSRGYQHSAGPGEGANGDRAGGAGYGGDGGDGN